MAESDDVNTLKRRGRRRLVGAIALVLAAVIVLPMVFDSEPRGTAPPVSVRIPSEDESGFTPKVTPKIIEPGRRIVIEWPGYSGPTDVEWIFTPLKDGAFVTITETGFTGDGDQLVKYVADSTQGFTLMLAGLKALLEHGVQLNLTADRYPKGIEHH